MTAQANTLLVLHPLGDPAGGQPWRSAFSAARWPGQVVAPDLPGHAGAEPPVGGFYELSDPAFFVASLELPSAVDVVVGVGASGWAAQLLALGGRTLALVLVDGSGAPWLQAEQRFESSRARLRAIFADSTTGPGGSSPAGLDRPLAHPPAPHGDRDLTQRALRAIEVPVLLVEPEDGEAGPGLIEVLDRSRGSRTVTTGQLTPEAVAVQTTQWWRSLALP